MRRLFFFAAMGMVVIAYFAGGKKVISHTGGHAPRNAASAIAFAEAQIGKPYVYGAAGPGSYDCSGLVMRAYGLSQRTSEEQWAALPHTSHPRRGDLVFFVGGDTSLDPSPGHVGIYLSPHEMIDAYGYGTYVRKESFGEPGSAPGLVLVGYAIP